MPPPRSRLRRAARWGLFLLLLWAGPVFVLKLLEDRLVFFPARADEAWAAPPDPATEDVWLTAADGTKLHAWHLPHPGADGAVLVSHGNAGNLSHRGRLAADLRRHLGLSVLVYDYPGYGKSAGAPSEAGCYAAGDAALRWLVADRKVPAGRVVLLGESLGGGVAVDLAARHDHRALVLVFTFTSLPAAAKVHYPWAPCETLMANRFDNLLKLPRCRRPVFVAHGTADGVVPFAHGERLFAAANPPKRFARLDGVGHTVDGVAEFLVGLKRFLDEAAGPGG